MDSLLLIVPVSQFLGDQRPSAEDGIQNQFHKDLGFAWQSSDALRDTNAMASQLCAVEVRDATRARRETCGKSDHGDH